MKLNLTPDGLAELAKLIAVKDENILISDILLSFLLNRPQLITDKDIQRMHTRGLEGDKAYAKALSIKLSEGRKDIMELLQRHLEVKCLSGLEKQYARNTYYHDLLSTKTKVATWSLDESSYAPYEAFAATDIESRNPYYLERTILGYFAESFSFPVVLEGKDTWMSITPHEIETMRKAIELVSGKVVVMGLGLGYFPYMASLKKNVKQIVIIENDADAISLFENHLLPLFPNREKITVIHADALEYAKEQLPNEHIDYCFIDLWRSVDDGLPLFLAMKKFEMLSIKTRFLYWLEDSLYAMVRRIIITLFQEALEGYDAKDYQKAKTAEDQIFNELYQKVAKRSFSSFQEIHDFLRREALDELLKKQ